jgi:hypothetical protein
MNSEKGEDGPDSSNGRVLKIREPAALALKGLEQLRAARPITQEVPDAEVARIAQEKLQPHGCSFVVRRLDDGISSFVMRVRGGEIRIRSRLQFLPTLQTDQLKRRRYDLWSWILEERRSL